MSNDVRKTIDGLAPLFHCGLATAWESTGIKSCAICNTAWSMVVPYPPHLLHSYRINLKRPLFPFDGSLQRRRYWKKVKEV